MGQWRLSAVTDHHGRQAVTDWASHPTNRIPAVQRLTQNLGARGTGQNTQEATHLTDDALNSVATPAKASPAPLAELPAAPTRPQIEPPHTTSPDFIADENGTVIPTSRTRLEEGFQNAGFPQTPTRSPGMQYDLPDGTSVRIMEPKGPNELRAVFKKVRKIISIHSRENLQIPLKMKLHEEGS